MKSLRGAWRQYWVAIRSTIILTIAIGIIYPIVMTGIAQVATPFQANGSLVSVDGRVVGSSLIGQSFTDKKGNPLPHWFQSRPSAAGDGYDANASSPSNLGPNNPELVKAIKQRRSTIEKTDRVTGSQIPPDAVTGSGSGLDPHISPEYALLQVGAVATSRGLSENTVRQLVESKIQGRDLAFLGQNTVNVLQLNIALSRLDPDGNK
jgi:K+-transporting ATPase ATPase C chain